MISDSEPLLNYPFKGLLAQISKIRTSFSYGNTFKARPVRACKEIFAKRGRAWLSHGSYRVYMAVTGSTSCSSF